MSFKISRIEPLGDVTFSIIDPRLLSKLFRMSIGVIGESLKDLEGVNTSAVLDGELSDVALKILSGALDSLCSEKIEFIRDSLFEHMICAGYGKNLKEGFNIIIDKHGCHMEFTLFIEAFKHYLLEQFKLAIGENALLAGLDGIKDAFKVRMNMFVKNGQTTAMSGTQS